MYPTISRVEGGRLYQPGRAGDPIDVGTLDWFEWLEQHAAFTFVDAVGSFTAYKSDRSAVDSPWEATGTQAGQRSRVRLGSTYMLTLERLQAAARTLAAQNAMGEPSEYRATRPTAHLGPAGALLQARLSPPRATGDAIARPRLLARLSAGLDGQVTLLCAPAGYGKTTLMAQWLATLARPVAWLSLEEADNELPVFVRELAATLQTVAPDACQASVRLHTTPQFPPLSEVISLLLGELADLPEDVLLVLDDYHLIKQDEIHTVITQMVEHLPPNLHLVLSSRTEPPLPLARWRARGQLNELGTAELRLTRDETATYLARLLVEQLASEAVAVLQEQTEGWVAMLRLAALSLAGSPDRAAFLARLGQVPDRTMSDYLVEEVLAQQAYAVQELLERVSILGQFNAELATVVLGGEATARQVQGLLDEVERTNLLLAPLDERPGWYRLHPLFQAVLAQRLQALFDPEELAELHRRASVWYAGQGLIDEAQRHAQAAGDGAAAARLVEARVLGAFEQEQWGQIEHWLRLIPQEQIQSSPVLLFAQAWVLQAHGQLMDFPQLLTTAERLLATRRSGASEPNEPPSWLLHALLDIAWSHFQYFTGQVQASLESARSALEWFPPGDTYLASHAMQYLSLSLQATGQEEMALVELQQALRASPVRPVTTARLLFDQAFVYLTSGKLPQVEQTTRHLLRLAQEARLVLSQNWAHWLLGVVSYEWNQLEAAAYHCSAVIANRHHSHLWAIQEAFCGLALAYQAQGLDKEAQETRDSLLDWVQEQHNLPQLLTAYSFCGRLALVQGQVEEARQWLELAGEHEVLGPMLFLEDPPVTRAWMLLAEGGEMSVAQGQTLLDRFLQHVEALHNTRKTIQGLALQAWAYHLQGRMPDALAALERALELGRPAGFIRTFADLPGLAPILQELRRRRKAQQVVDKRLGAYLQRILTAMHLLPAQGATSDELLRHEGLELLTERELRILRLLNQELTNKQIARELVVTPGTVKVHTNNLYRKLGVDNRRAAVTLAKALGLLAAS